MSELKSMLQGKLEIIANNDGIKKKLYALAILFFMLWIVKYAYSGYETTDNAFIEGNVVNVTSKIPGYVKTILVKDNQKVATGDVLFELDATDYEHALLAAQAALDAITAHLQNAKNNFETALIAIPSSYQSAKAQYDVAVAALEKASADLNRLRGQNELTRTQQSWDYAIAAFKTAQSQAEDAKAKLKSADTVTNAIAAQQASLDELKAKHMQAEVAVAQAQSDLDNTKVRASYSGTVTNRSVEVGTYLQIGRSAMTLVGEEFWVIANFKETQLENIKIGNAVEISIDAFPKLKLHGKIDSIQLGTGSRMSLFPAENATGNFVKIVQRIPVKISLEASEYKDIPIAVGMSAVPVVYFK